MSFLKTVSAALVFYPNRIDLWMKRNYENRALLPDNDAKDIKKKSSLVLPDNHRSCGPFALKDPELTIIPDSCIYQVPLAALADGGDRLYQRHLGFESIPL